MSSVTHHLPHDTFVYSDNEIRVTNKIRVKNKIRVTNKKTVTMTIRSQEKQKQQNGSDLPRSVEGKRGSVEEAWKREQGSKLAGAERIGGGKPF